MRIYRFSFSDRGDHLEVRATYPVAERPKKGALEKDLAARLREWADLLEAGGWQDGGTSTGKEAETRMLVRDASPGTAGR